MLAATCTLNFALKATSHRRGECALDIGSRSMQRKGALQRVFLLTYEPGPWLTMRLTRRFIIDSCQGVVGAGGGVY